MFIRLPRRFLENTRTSNILCLPGSILKVKAYDVSESKSWKLAIALNLVDGNHLLQWFSILILSCCKYLHYVKISKA